MMAHWQLGFKYAGESVNSLVDTVDEPNTMQDAYSLVDASIGVENATKDACRGLHQQPDRRACATAHQPSGLLRAGHN